MRLVLFTATLAVGFASALHAASRFPFPRNGTYRYGTKVSASAMTATGSEVQAAFDAWKADQLDSSGIYMRVKFDDPATTVSEGIGYGMLILVYMDNASNNTKGQFDKMWAYYRKWTNTNAVMHWKINGFTSVTERNGATDAELDVALALLMAHKQWGDESYLTNAKALIKAIWCNEVNLATRRLMPGDAWDAFKNPSYVSPAAFELFRQVDKNAWDELIANEYAMLDANTSKQPSGLPSDWCDAAGNPVSGFSSLQFGYDAIRTPWRLALGYSWFGHPQAKAIDARLLGWIANAPISSKPAGIVDGYNLDGSAKGKWNVSTFVGALGSAGMTDSVKSQAWVDGCYARLRKGADGKGYFNSSLKVLYMLHMSGNLNNLWDTAAPTTGIAQERSVATVRQANRRLEILPAGDSWLQAEVTDLQGRIRKTARSAQGKLEMELGHLPQGTYLLRLTSREGRQERTFALFGN